ncbi:MAG: VCBS repeat-containing protein, partial [Silvibacterium sp.]|nr:VCBS repeat-containing protein [Silvibacterium sp.]
VMLGKGDGTFQSPVATSIGNIELFGGQFQPFAVGDFDGDGKLDVVIEGGMSGTNGRHDVFVVFTGKGDGTFTVGTPIQISPSPISSTGSYSSNSGSVTVADFNGDGKDDIAVLNDDVVQVLLSNGDGTFTAAASIDSGAETDPDWLALATGDFNGDGIPDFAAANSDAQSATIALGQRTETAAATLASVSVPGSGAHNIEAVYEGDSNFATSISSPIQLTGSPVATTLILASSTSSTTYGTQVMLTATLAPYSEGGLATNGETVTFLNNGTSIGTGKLSSGVAVLNTTSLPVGTDKLTASYAGDTNFNSAAAQAVSVQVNNPPPPPTGLQFIPVTPCRIADTRNATGPFGGPELATNSTRSFNIPQSACNIPSTAAAYSLNVTVVPGKTLNYLTLWPTGEAQPNVSTLNSFDGRVKANAAIVPAGTSGAVSVYVTDATHVILDIDGYFVPSSSNNSSALAFYPLAPCRIADTRNPSGSLGGPSIAGNTSRAFPVQSSNCNIPSTAKAYSLNVTAIPHKTLNYLTTWPTGQAQPYVSTLNAPTGTVVANAAIVPAGTTGQVSIFVSDTSDVILDINGYFAPPETGGLSLYAVTPCRLIDTRPTAFNATKTVNVEGSACAPPSSAEAYVLNATVVPPGELIYLTLWPAGPTQPYVSTLNALDGAITSNMAIVPTTNGSIDAFSSNPTNLILDISSYFAPPPPSPTITISVSPATVAPGMAATLTWSARNAIACSASGTWSGSQSTAGSLVLSETAVGNYRYSLSCTGNGSPTSGSASLLVTRVKPSSYENKNDMSNAPVSFSDLNLLNAFAVADFFNDGSTSLVLHTLEYNPTNPSTYNNYGHIHFYKQDQKGNWTDQTSTLLANNTGCLHPRKAVVADFNQDGKPDVLFACHGLDVAPYPGEQPHVLLSEPDGTYANVTIPITCYCHGASAADINGDGYPDVLVTDTTVAQTPFFLINHGGTSFQPDYTRLPSSLKGKQIYSAELIDFSGSGYYDVFLGGNEPGTTSYPASEFDPTILPNDGKGDFIITTPVDLLAGNSFGLALDIVYQNGSVYLLKVNNAYTSSEIEKIAYPSFKGVTIYSHSTTYPNGSTWLDWIVPYNGQLVSEDASYQVSVAE